MKRRDQIRDMCYPLIFMLAAVIVVTLVVSIIAAVITGIRVEQADELRSVPLIASSAFYVFTLFSQRNYIRLDELRFGQDVRRVKPPILLPAIAAAMAGSDLLERVIAAAGLYELFPAYSTVASAAFTDQNLLLLILATVVLAPLAEELVFRGMMYRRIRHYKGNPAAIVLSSLAFGIYHMNMIQLIYAFVLGLLFAWLYEHTETLIVPVCCHAAANAWALAVEYLIDQPQRLSGRFVWGFPAAEAVIFLGCLLILIHRFQADGKSVSADTES